MQGGGGGRCGKGAGLHITIHLHYVNGSTLICGHPCEQILWGAGGRRRGGRRRGRGEMVKSQDNIGDVTRQH